jgi:hypothetical protein
VVKAKAADTAAATATVCSSSLKRQVTVTLNWCVQQQMQRYAQLTAQEIMLDVQISCHLLH